MPTTSNFGWTTPADTDLVKNGALAIRTLGNGIDTSLVDLKGGTTGQVLSKASNTDMDFTWTTDASGISPTIVDAKGDLIAASAADTPARLAVGNNGETLVADSSASQGLRWQGNFAAGKNKIINGDFNINQRGFTSTTADSTYMFDRFLTSAFGGGTSTFSAQTFTAGTAPVAGYEAINFLRVATTGQSAASDITAVRQRIEDVRTLAGQTFTISFWAKASSGTPSVAITWQQSFGSGGSATVFGTGQKTAITTSWARYSLTFNIDSVAGKTIGSSSFLQIWLQTSAGSDYNSRTNSLGIQTATIDFWGVQVEAGSVATAFQTATGTLAGELAACQRYYWRQTGDATVLEPLFGIGMAYSTTNTVFPIKHPVTMRVAPTSVDFSTLQLTDFVTSTAVTSLTLSSAMNNATNAAIVPAVASGLTQYRPYELRGANSASAYLGFSAEL